MSWELPRTSSVPAQETGSRWQLRFLMQDRVSLIQLCDLDQQDIPQPCPGPVVLLVSALSQYTKVVGSIPGESTYKNQPMIAQIPGATNQCFSLLPLSLLPTSLSLEGNCNRFKKRYSTVPVNLASSPKILHRYLCLRLLGGSANL